jgi:hypothetical protein
MYEMFRKIEDLDELRADDLVIRLQNMPNDPCTAATELLQILVFKDREIYNLKEARILPLVCKCFEFYRKNQADINAVTQQNMSGAIWDTLNFIRQQRNIVVHEPITQNDIKLLNDSVQYFQKYQTKYTADYRQAVQWLANALRNSPPQLLAAPNEYDLANLLQ